MRAACAARKHVHELTFGVNSTGILLPCQAVFYYKSEIVFRTEMNTARVKYPYVYDISIFRDTVNSYLKYDIYMCAVVKSVFLCH